MFSVIHVFSDVVRDLMSLPEEIRMPKLKLWLKIVIFTLFKHKILIINKGNIWNSGDCLPAFREMLSRAATMAVSSHG